MTKPLESATFDRPVKARLVVVPEYGDSWDATDEDLEKFGYADRRALMNRARALLRDIIGEARFDDRDEVSMIRYLIEYVVLYDHDMDAGDKKMIKDIFDSAGRHLFTDDGERVFDPDRTNDPVDL